MWPLFLRALLAIGHFHILKHQLLLLRHLLEEEEEAKKRAMISSGLAILAAIAIKAHYSDYDARFLCIFLS